MIIAYSDVGESCDILIKTEDEEKYIVEYRINKKPITHKLFNNYDKAEKYYQELVTSITGEEEDV